MQLSWAANSESDIVGYKIYYDVDESGYPYANSVSTGNKGTSYTLTDLTIDGNYYVSVAAVDSDGNESWISNEIKIFPSDGEYNDYFGKSISLYENWLAVSSIYDDENGYKSGSVYIFHYNGSTWQEFSKIIPEDGAPSDRFGYSLDIDLLPCLVHPCIY